MSNLSGPNATVVTNRLTYTIFRFLILVLVLALISDVTFSLLPGSIGQLFEDHYLAIGSLALLFLISLLGVNYYFYDDGYEILHIRAKSVWNMGLGISSQLRYDFPKRKVVNYEIQNKLFGKKLLLTLDKFASDTIKVRAVTLSFISQSDLKRIQTSLDKMIEKHHKESKD